MKKTITGICMILTLTVFVCAFTACGEESTVIGKKYLTVYTLNMGKADAIILKTEEHTVVIDTGDNDNVTPLTDTVRSLGSLVDALIISHYDEDHIGGVKKLTTKAEVKAAYLPEYEKGTNAQNTRAYLSKENIPQTVVTEKSSLIFDGVEFILLPTEIFFKRNDEPSNESSLAVLVKYGKTAFLFTGDAEARRLPELAQQVKEEYDGQFGIDFLKVPHHGNADENSEAFFRALSPVYAVITCESKEDAEVKDILSEIGCGVYFTCSGTVIAESDGSVVSVHYK